MGAPQGRCWRSIIIFLNIDPPMSSAIYSCSYFPNIAYLSSMLHYDEVLIEGKENYVRQSYRSRCFIKGPNGILPLIVPVIGGRKKILIKEIKIAYDESWRDQHLRSIVSCYGKAPFFEHYFDYIEPIFRKKHIFLYDLCIDTMTLCLKMLKLEISWKATEDFVRRYESPQNDLRNIFQAKDLETLPFFFHPQKYFQLFGKQFVANLSVLDLIMSTGTQAPDVLRASFLG